MSRRGNQPDYSLKDGDYICRNCRAPDTCATETCPRDWLARLRKLERQSGTLVGCVSTVFLAALTGRDAQTVRQRAARGEYGPARQAGETEASLSRCGIVCSREHTGMWSGMCLATYWHCMRSWRVADNLVDGTVYRSVRIEVYETSGGSFRYTTSVSVSGSGMASKEEAMIRAKRKIDKLHNRR